MEEHDLRKIICIVPLRAAATCSNWGSTAQLCAETVAGLLSAGDHVHVVLVVNNKPPNLAYHERLSILEVDFPIPNNHDSRMRDKIRKVEVGLDHAVRNCPAWIMKVDADDLVSHRFLAELGECHDLDLALIDNGYIWKRGSNWLRLRRQFHLFCGTSYAVFFDRVGRLDFEDARHALLLPHHTFQHWIQGKELDYMRVEYPAAVYQVEHGDNAVHKREGRPRFLINRATLSKLWNMRPLTKRVRNEFQIL